MRQANQINRTKAMILGLFIASAASFTSCAPKYGCYYGMHTPTSQDTESCETERAGGLANADVSLTSH